MQDFKHAFRILLKSPGFTAMAVLAIALGVGANSAIFSVVYSVLLRALPFPDSDRLVTVWDTQPQLATAPANPIDFLDWSEQNSSFEHMAAFLGGKTTVTAGELPEDTPSGVVSSNFFDVLGVAPAVGRAFTPDEQQRGRHRVAILSAALSQRLFGSGPESIGKTITVSGNAFTVVGVMPGDFRFPGKSEIWVPLVIDSAKPDRGPHYLNVIARLRSNVSLQQAQADMSTIAYRLQEQFPEKIAGHGVKLALLRDSVVGDIKPALWVLLAAVGLVLLIACADVANLLLARAIARQKEFAIRAALGASRWRVIRQLLSESVLLATVGGAMGLLVSVWAVKALVAAGGRDIPRSDEIGLSLPVVVFTLAVSLATAVIFGLAPALHASNPDLNESLKEGSRGMTSGVSRNRTRGLLVVSEVAIALILLTGAGLMIKSFARLQAVSPGFNPDHVLTAQVTLLKATYPEDPQVNLFNQQFVQRLRSLPGIVSAGATGGLPMSGSFSNDYFQIEGRPVPPPGERPLAECRLASPSYFQTMQIPLLQGRDLSDQDSAGAPGVVVVNETMARRFWSDEAREPSGASPSGASPIGQHLTFQGQEGGPLTIIGIVGDVRDFGLDLPPSPTVYFSYLQNALKLGDTRYLTFVLRTASEPGSLASTVRSEALSMDKGLPVHDVKTMDDYLLESVARRRFNMLLLGIFAGVALLLAGVGIYGVTSYSVSQRTHEIGIRMALGARGGFISGLVLKQSIVPVLLGIALGMGFALALTRFISSLLFDVSATDPATLAAVSIFMILVAAAASYIPARRATGVDPMTALRCE